MECFRYQSEFGFIIPNRDIVVDDVRVRGAAHTQFFEQNLINIASDIYPEAEKV